MARIVVHDQRSDLSPELIRPKSLARRAFCNCVARGLEERSILSTGLYRRRGAWEGASAARRQEPPKSRVLMSEQLKLPANIVAGYGALGHGVNHVHKCNIRA